ncbi:MAG: hypothetical protein J6M62_00995 [Selenomonadaceae bacterium]|nr:hypothetical protein [Selenomonadaceae bacterium]MBP3723103.1 hypothetical protein [Selenomonadaceae bacterium]
MEKTFDRVFYDEDILRIKYEMRHPEIFDDEINDTVENEKILIKTPKVQTRV